MMPIELFDMGSIAVELEAPEYELQPSLGGDCGANGPAVAQLSTISQDLSKVLDDLHSRDGNPVYLEKPKRRSKRFEAAESEVASAEIH